jgi:uncharacterized metal-binding protein
MVVRGTMPSGRTHLRIEVLLLAVWTAVGVLFARQDWIGPAELAGFIVAYLFSMLLLSPDLDLAKSDSYRRWGPLRWLWAPYAAAFRHRRVSHHPLFGPITRIAYVGLLALTGLLVYFLASRTAAPRITFPAKMIYAVLIGLYVPNLTHILADGTQSVWVRLRTRL